MKAKNFAYGRPLKLLKCANNNTNSTRLYHCAVTVHYITCKQRCKNVPTCQQCLCKKNLVLLRKLVMLRFCAFCWHFWHILELHVTFWHFFCTIWVFLGLLHCFVAIQICHNLRTFLVKYFWLKPCLCKKKKIHVCLQVTFTFTEFT